MTKEDWAMQQRGSKRCGGKPLKKERGQNGSVKTAGKERVGAKKVQQCMVGQMGDKESER